MNDLRYLLYSLRSVIYYYFRYKMIYSPNKAKYFHTAINIGAFSMHLNCIIQTQFTVCI